MVQTPKRNPSTSVSSTASSLSEVAPLAEVPTITSKKKVVKSCRSDNSKCTEAPETTLKADERYEQPDTRKPWGRSRSFDEPTERMPIALPVTLTQALRLKSVMVKRTPSQIIAELLRSYL